MTQPSYAPRPFLARGSNIPRCDACLLPQQACICEFQPEVQAQAQFLLLMHRKEKFKPSNTGRLVTQAIAGSKSLEWSRTEPCDELMAVLQDPALDPYLVFPPGPGYEDRMTEFEAKPGKTPLLIIPDGTWRQARRIFRHSEYLQQLPVLALETERTTRYGLRRQSDASHLCTAEVAAAMLEQIGDRHSAAVLDAYFEVFNTRYAQARRKQPPHDLSEAIALLENSDRDSSSRA